MSVTRREWLKSAVGTPALLALAPVVPDFLTRTARAAASSGGQRDTMLVVLQLSGGNDGLNTVVPYEDDAYGRNRRTLRLTEKDVHKIDASLGLHAEMQAYWKLYQERQAAIVQGVGYPNNNRSHDDAMRDWYTARPGDAVCPTGWLGRAVDVAAPADAPALPGVFVGPIPTPFALNAERNVIPAIRSSDAGNFRAVEQIRNQSHRVRQLLEASVASRANAGGPGEDPLLSFVSRNAQAAYGGSERLEQVLRQADGAGDYPPFQLAGHLKVIAQLMRAELGIRIFFAELGGGGIGGFDNHAGQRDNHAALLRQLSESVAAFVRDVRRAGMLERVVLMTFSEFGRTLAENGRRGTDHGDAQPVLLAGGRLRGGLVGSHPRLDKLNVDSPASHTDFRRLYATMLDGWLGLDSKSVLGERFEPLELFA
jgi:uncharacterized protein (DUF1501 family)